MYSNFTDLRPGRFAKHLPLVSALVLNPFAVAFVFAFMSLAVSIFSIHYGLSMIIMSMPFMSYYLERNLLERILIPPFSCVVIWEALGSGLGVAFIVYGNGGGFDPYLLRVQIVTLLCVPFGWFFYRLGFGVIPRMTFPEIRSRFDLDVVRPLVWVGWFFLLYQVFRTIVLAKTGALDRGDFGLIAMDAKSFGIWSYFNLFPRFNSFAFFLFPLFFQRSSVFGKAIGLGLLGVYFLIALVSGSRGIVFFPVIFIVVGLYFFRSLKNAKLDVWGVVLMIVMLPLVVFIDAYRNTDAYRATSTLDIVGRIRALDDGYEKLISADENITDIEGRNYVTLGSALLGVMDSLVYQLTPAGIPYAGFEGFNAIPYTFVPTFIKRDKPLLLDSNPILWRYTGRIDRTGKAMSLPADAYRRFGWFGVLPVVALFFWIYGLLCGKCYRIYLSKDALWGILLILFLLSFIQSRPFGTILETWWHFSYNLSKHLVVLYIGYWGLKKILSIRGRGGAIQYGGRQ